MNEPNPALAIQDVNSLYRSLSPRLKLAVHAGVSASEPAIEDACQVAWSRLLTHRDRIRGASVLPWLTATAINEALRTLRLGRRELPLDPELTAVLAENAPTSGGDAESGTEFALRVSALRALPLRQQRLLWLQGLGFSYTEMAAREGCTTRTVERQVLRARRQLRAVGA